MERLLRSDAVVRVLSLVLALMMWIQVTGDQTQPENRPLPGVPLAVLNEAPALRQLGAGLPATVAVDLSGPRRDLRRLRVEDIRASVDLANLKPGVHTVRLDLQGVPPGVRAVPKPEVVTVRLERYEERTMPITLSERERVIADRRYVIELKETNISVAGLAPEVSRVVQVVARPDLSGITETTTRIVALRGLDASGADVDTVQLTPTQVEMKIDVVRLPPPKAVQVRPIWKDNPPEGYGISDATLAEPAVINVRGPQERHAQWTEIMTTPISLQGQTRPFKVQVGLVKPPGVEMMDTEVVTVTVDIVELRMERVLKLPVSVHNLASNLELEATVPEVTLRIYGTKRQLDAMDPLALALRVDAENRGPGKHQLPIRFNPREGIEVFVEPQSIELSIKEKREHQSTAPAGR